MMKYYNGLKDSIELFIKEQYEFRTSQVFKAKIYTAFEYRLKGDVEWKDGEHFGKQERQFIADAEEFTKWQQKIKSYFPYRHIQKMAVDMFQILHNTQEINK